MSGKIKFSDEQLLLLSVACRQLPSKPSPSTLWRWRTIGVKVNGRTIKLACVRVGGKWYTTAAAFADFLQEQTDAALNPSSDDLPVERTADAARRLQSAGLI
jgi:hypothetical protein